jgi:hypothetical protein
MARRSTHHKLAKAKVRKPKLTHAAKPKAAPKAKHVVVKKVGTHRTHASTRIRTGSMRTHHAKVRVI